MDLLVRAVSSHHRTAAVRPLEIADGRIRTDSDDDAFLTRTFARPAIKPRTGKS